MRNSYAKSSAKSVMADPPKAVGKITIRKKGDVIVGEEIVSQFEVDFTLKFDSPAPVFTPPVVGNLINWVRTPLGVSSGYPETQIEANPLALDTSPGAKPSEIHFSGGMSFHVGDGSGSGVMYKAEIQVSNQIPTTATEVEIFE